MLNPSAERNAPRNTNGTARITCARLLNTSTRFTIKLANARMGGRPLKSTPIGSVGATGHECPHLPHQKPHQCYQCLTPTNPALHELLLFFFGKTME